MSYRRVIVAWLTLAVAMIVNGTFRELFLRQAVGPSQADAMSAALGAIIILLVTRPFFRSLANRSLVEIMRVSLLLVALTVSFEALFGRYVDGKSWSELLADYAIWRGRLWPVLLALIAATPFVWARWVPSRGRRESAAPS
jgi:hypothetical protein